MLNIEKFDAVTAARAQFKFLGFPVAVCIYTVDGLLVDTGCQNMSREIIPFFNEAGLQQAVITHCHEDHTGMAYWLDKKLGLPIYVHPNSVQSTRKTPYVPTYRQWIWGTQQPFNSIAVGTALQTAQYNFDVVETPGHSADHIILHEKNQGWLFGGDIFVGIKQRLSRKQESVPAEIQSLKNVLQLDFDTVFCGHGGVFTQGKRLIRQKLNYLEDMRARVLELSSKGFNPKEISHQLFPHKDPLTDLSQGEWSSYNMVLSICEPQTV